MQVRHYNQPRRTAHNECSSKQHSRRSPAADGWVNLGRRSLPAPDVVSLWQRRWQRARRAPWEAQSDGKSFAECWAAFSVAAHLAEETDPEQNDNRGRRAAGAPIRGRIFLCMLTIILLTISNIFMTVAWYGHLRHRSAPLWQVILVSWGIAFFEYCFRCQPTVGATGNSRRRS